MLRSFRCGSVVMPNATPICVSASVCSIGASRSMTGPSNCWMNAADTRLAPAARCTGAVLSVTPVVASVIRGSISRTATRAPSIETSSCSPVAVPPNSTPQALPWRSIRKTYSPSAGNVCSTEMPPRVPSGAPSTRRIWDAVFATL